MKHAHIDTNNKLLGWYDSDIHATIPTPNVEVTEDVWQNAISNGHNTVYADGTTTLADYRTLDELKEQKASALHAKYQAKLYGGYTSSALGTPHTYSTVEEARNDLFAAVGLGISLKFYCADAVTGVKSNPLHTTAQLSQVAGEMAGAKVSLIETFYTHRDFIMAAVDNAALDLALANGLAAIEAVVTV